MSRGGIRGREGWLKIGRELGGGPDGEENLLDNGLSWTWGIGS